MHLDFLYGVANGVVVGGSIVGALGAASPETAGISLVGVGVGVVVSGHGAATSVSWLTNLADKKGRVSEMNSNGNSGGEKGGGKNGAHANQKAKESAAQKYETAKGNLNELKSKPNKTPEDKTQIKKLEGQVKQLQEKKDFSGENHSRNAKGNR